jgi:thioredoxin-related protein
MKPLPPRHEPFADATVPEPHASGLRHGPVRALPWTAILAIALLVLCVIADTLQAGNPAPVFSKHQDGFFPPTADLAAALEQARTSGRKGVAVLFEMEGCGECAKLRATTFKDSRLREAYEGNFVTVSLMADQPLPLRNFDRQPTQQTDFSRAERVFALPTLVFYDLDGLPVARQLGSAGDTAQWIRLARYVSTKGYEDAPFSHWQAAE